MSMSRRASSGRFAPSLVLMMPRAPWIELRTPLTSIHGALGIINTRLGANLPEEARRLIDIAYRNSRRLARLVDNVLDLQKIESGTVTFEIQTQPLRPLLEQALE